MSKYFVCEVIVKIPDEEYKHWDCGCDETFGVGFFHDPDKGIYVTDIKPMDATDEAIEELGLLTQIFTKEGGI